MEGESSAAIGVLVQNLLNILKDGYFLKGDLNREAEQLQKTLGTTLTYLNDDAEKSVSEWTFGFWLRKVKVLATDADNVMDEHIYHLLHKKVKEMEPPKYKVPSFFSSSNQIVRTGNMALKIKQINKDFESINKKAAELGLRQSMIVNAPAIFPHVSSETDSFTPDPIFIGRDDEVSEIVEKLTKTRPEEQKFSILAILGMGGLGKTCLARTVFNHEKVKARFGSLIWVHVSEIFDPIILLKKILSTLISTVGVESEEVILKKLQEALEDKTYLIVLDDVWIEDVPEWEYFINSISGVTSTEGNAIIITTRNYTFASIVHHIHTLYGLSVEECWSIIKANTFDENGQVPSSEFEVIGRKIARRCQGSPLAANVVGGVLFGCKSEKEWHFIYEDRLSHVEGGEYILRILRLGYDSLSSPSLKTCFAYCSIFPKGWEIMKQKLIEMWMAEGFLEADGRKEEMESVGNKFFNILLHNSLLQIVSRDDDGNVWSCQLHDLVHDLASSCLGMGGNDSNGFNPIPKKLAKYLRTLFFRGNTSGTMFSQFESLRNLTLAGFDKVEELPSGIRKLIRLRNLDISPTSIKNLPKWMVNSITCKH